MLDLALRWASGPLLLLTLLHLLLLLLLQEWGLLHAARLLLVLLRLWYRRSKLRVLCKGLLLLLLLLLVISLLLHSWWWPLLLLLLWRWQGPKPGRGSLAPCSAPAAAGCTWGQRRLPGHGYLLWRQPLLLLLAPVRQPLACSSRLKPGRDAGPLLLLLGPPGLRVCKATRPRLLAAGALAKVLLLIELWMLLLVLLLPGGACCGSVMLLLLL
jgi:hypothetical protein